MYFYQSITTLKTNEPTHTIDTYPKQGDVIADVDGFNIKVVDVTWI